MTTTKFPNDDDEKSLAEEAEERKIKAEQKRFEKLLKDVRAELEQWIEWAEWKADECDPVRRNFCDLKVDSGGRTEGGDQCSQQH